MITKKQYVEYLVSTPKNCTCTYLAEHLEDVSHDVVNDFLRQKRLMPRETWKLVKDRIDDSPDAFVIVDDSVHDKRYSRFIELVRAQYSGNEHRVVRGIRVVSLVHSAGKDEDFYPIDYRVYAPDVDGKTKNDHFHEMFLNAVDQKLLQARTILFDGWYASAETQWDLVIVTANPNNLAYHMQLARFAYDNKLPSLFGSLQGFEAFVGPLVRPGETACWNCCRLRLLANAGHPKGAHAVQALHFEQPPNIHPRIGLVPMVPLLGHLLALEALKFLSGYSYSQMLGRLLIQNLITLETTTHMVIPMPWCEVCGGAQVMNQAQGASSQWAEVGTPEELCRLLAGWVDARTGVISHLLLKDQDITAPELPICAEAYLSEYTEGIYESMAPKGCGGKGLTATEAMIGAVGEALERYSAARIRLDKLRYAPIHALPGDVLDPRQLCLYNEGQHDRPGFPFVRFNPNDSHFWVLGHWIDNGEPVWVPALSAFMVFPLGDTPPFCQVTSNGLATGVDLDDASLRAIFELVERDAFMLTWLCRLPGRRLILDDASGSDITRVLKQLGEFDIKVELYLLDVGLSIPSVVCLGVGDGKNRPAVTVSAAAHLSPSVAVRKAVLELGYTLSYLCPLMNDSEHRIPERPEQVRTFRDHGLFYVPAERMTAFDFLQLRHDEPCPLSTLQEPKDISLAACAERLSADGVRVACVDVTSPDVAQGPFRIVRAIGPNLQPIHCGYGMERLNNPRLRALLSGEINPDPHPFT